MTRPSKCNVGYKENNGERVELHVFAVYENAVVNVAIERHISDVRDSAMGEVAFRPVKPRAKDGPVEMMNIPEVVAR